MTSALQYAPSEVPDFWSNLAPKVPSLRSMLVSGSQVFLGVQQILNQAPSCPNAQISCQNTSVVEDLCCFNAPGGQMLQTQFWDTSPPTGPSDAWTMHGLWPDHCDGTFDQYCDDSRHYKNITAILSSFGASSLLDIMTTYWKDFRGDDENLWAHEWNKHGTCVSTLSPSCYPSYNPQQEVLDYFQSAVSLYQTLPSYEWLAEAGIVPSNTATYTKAQIQDALESKHGKPVTIGCRAGRFDEIWYHFDVKGSVQTGQFIAADPDGPKGKCPTTGIKYLPKRSSGSPTSTARTTTAAPTHTSVPGTPFSGKGFLHVRTSGYGKGCIIGAGQWYTSGSCATFTATRSGDSGFTLSSRRGRCALNKKGALTCAAWIRDPVVFENDDGVLSLGGNSTFYADGIPHGRAKGNVFVAEEGHGTELEIVWKSTSG